MSEPLDTIAADETFYYSDPVPSEEFSVQFVEACIADAMAQGLPVTARFGTSTNKDEEPFKTRVIIWEER